VGKYQPLGEFLKARDAEAISMTFAEIEKVLGFKLPPAQVRRAQGATTPRNVMAKALLEAGYEADVDLGGRTVVFRRVGPVKTALDPTAGKRGHRHPLFGALKGMITIMPGTDLTEPADPEWADIALGPERTVAKRPPRR
jgi:hypothetical protein